MHQSRHLDVLAALLADVGTGGNLTSDAHLAALAVEHRATVVTYDADFGATPVSPGGRPGRGRHGGHWCAPAGTRRWPSP